MDFLLDSDNCETSLFSENASPSENCAKKGSSVINEELNYEEILNQFIVNEQELDLEITEVDFMFLEDGNSETDLFNWKMLDTEELYRIDIEPEKPTVEKPYHCSTCQQSFSYSSYLKIHERVHSGSKLATRKNPKSSQLEIRNIHGAHLKPFECALCGKFYSTVFRLRDHLQSHKEVVKTDQLIEPKSCDVPGNEYFECAFCGKFYFALGSLKVHLENHASDKPPKWEKPLSSIDIIKSFDLNSYECGTCGKYYGSLKYLRIHFQAHKDNVIANQSYECMACGSRFQQYDSLEVHYRAHGRTLKVNYTGQSEASYRKDLRQSEASYRKDSNQSEASYKRHTCQTCGKTFSKYFTLKHHWRVHGQLPWLDNNKIHTVKRQQCAGKRLGLTLHCRSHLRKIFNKTTKSHVCNICGKSFSKSFALENHSRVHSGARPFQCKICQRSFSLLNALTVHSRLHSGDRPFVCRICGKSFIQSNSLKEHCRTHTNERPYECSECKKGYKSYNALKVHLRVHTGEKPYKCPFCMKGFSQASSMKTHVRTHTNERPYTCEVCGRRFKQSGTMLAHARTH